jgi:hypothetical protein
MGSLPLPRWAGGHCWYPTDQVPLCTRLKSSPIALDSTPGRKGLRCHCISPWLQTRFWCRRALASQRAPWHRGRHPTGKGFGVATCPTAIDPLLVREGSSVATCSLARHPAGKGSGVATTPDLPPGTGGLWGRHVRLGPSPHREGLRCRHVFRGSRPASRCGRALASSRAPRPLAQETCPCVPKAPDIWLIMASPGTRSRQCIKCVQDKPNVAYD